MDKFTCVSCHVAFKDSEIQRQHYKTDWHRYNLKRKVAEFPPLTCEDFNRKVLAQREHDAELNAPAACVYCKSCRKSFGNGKAFDNHLQSKKHRENEARVDTTSETQIEDTVVNKTEEIVGEEDSDVEEVDSDEWDEEVDVRQCLFCTHHSRSLLVNLKHMTEVHSFFLPDVEFCVDIQGLIGYLGEKIQQGFMCLWCNEAGRTFHSADSARSHMLDKGHCKMIHDGPALAEYIDFYDYSKSYPDANDDSVSADQEVKIPELNEDDYQLVLPSGSVIGHRSLFRYFKQSFDPNRITAVAARNNKKIHKVLADYRSLGWTPEAEVQAARRARDIHYMKRQQSKYYAKLGIRANKLQPHFRQQVLF